MGRENKGKFKPSCDRCVVSELQKCRPFVLDAKLRLTSLLPDFGTLHSGLLQQHEHMFCESGNLRGRGGRGRSQSKVALARSPGPAVRKAADGPGTYGRPGGRRGRSGGAG